MNSFHQLKDQQQVLFFEPYHIQEERYGEMYRQQWEKTIEGRKQMLDDLLAKRRAGSWQKTGVHHIAS